MAAAQDDIALWGALREGVHVAGYSFERACRSMETLLEGNRWKLGGMFKTVDEFMNSIGLDKLRGTAEERKRIAARIKELQPAVSNRKVAKVLGVSKDTVRGDLSPSATENRKENSRSAATSGDKSPPQVSGARAAAIVESRVAKVETTQERRAERERKLGAKILAFPEAKFGVILADPEWHDEVWSEDTGHNKGPVQHYGTSDIDTIKQRPVSTIAADDCVLFLWTTNQHLRQALDVVEAWGFSYRSNYVWRKPSISLGRWNRSAHEILLIGVRGDPPCPAAGTQWASVIDAARGRHSQKPDEVLEMIEQYYPTLPKIELNRRGPPREGWSAWGDEVQAAE